MIIARWLQFIISISENTPFTHICKIQKRNLKRKEFQVAKYIRYIHNMKEYRKIATVKAKIFEAGDEDGFIHPDGFMGMMEDVKYGFTPTPVPYISTLENQYHRGEFGKHYVCVGIDGERWLVEKDIFERTYEQIN